MKRASNLVVLFMAVLMLALLIDQSESMGGFVVLVLIVLVGGAAQFFGRLFFKNLARFSGEALFEDRQPEKKFDVDAAFERAMRRRDRDTR